MTHVSLFTGIGGLDLAAEWAGFETVLQVEREPFALQVLEKHWPDVPRITDVREVQNDERWREPTVVSGGFPCQPFSAAGKRRGTEDDRYLWPELLRIVEELRPAWVVGENVSGLLSIREGMEIDDMLASLEARNYTPWVLHYPAAGVGAHHKRDRVFIVAYTESRNPRKQTERQGREDFGRASQDVADTERAGQQGRQRKERAGRYESNRHGADVADTQRERRSIWKAEKQQRERVDTNSIHTERHSSRRPTESRMGGMAHGLPSWMDGEHDGIPRVATGVKDRAARLKALGNAVVPQQAYPIFAAIAKTVNEGG